MFTLIRYTNTIAAVLKQKRRKVKVYVVKHRLYTSPARLCAYACSLDFFPSIFPTLGKENATGRMRIIYLDRDVSARNNDTGRLDTRSRAKLPRCRLYPTGLLGTDEFSQLLLLYFAEMRSNGRPSAKFVAASAKLDARCAPTLPNKVLDSIAARDADQRRCFMHPEETTGSWIVKRSVSMNNKSNRTRGDNIGKKGRIAANRKAANAKERRKLVRGS